MAVAMNGERRLNAVAIGDTPEVKDGQVLVRNAEMPMGNPLERRPARRKCSSEHYGDDF